MRMADDLGDLSFLSKQPSSLSIISAIPASIHPRHDNNFRVLSENANTVSMTTSRSQTVCNRLSVRNAPSVSIASPRAPVTLNVPVTSVLHASITPTVPLTSVLRVPVTPSVAMTSVLRAPVTPTAPVTSVLRVPVTSTVPIINVTRASVTTPAPVTGVPHTPLTSTTVPVMCGEPIKRRLASTQPSQANSVSGSFKPPLVIPISSVLSNTLKRPSPISHKLSSDLIIRPVVPVSVPSYLSSSLKSSSCSSSAVPLPVSAAASVVSGVLPAGGAAGGNVISVRLVEGRVVTSTATPSVQCQRRVTQAAGAAVLRPATAPGTPPAVKPHAIRVVRPRSSTHVDNTAKMLNSAAPSAVNAANQTSTVAPPTPAAYSPPSSAPLTNGEVNTSHVTKAAHTHEVVDLTGTSPPPPTLNGHRAEPVSPPASAESAQQPEVTAVRLEELLPPRICRVEQLAAAVQQLVADRDITWQHDGLGSMQVAHTAPIKQFRLNELGLLEVIPQDSVESASTQTTAVATAVTNTGARKACDTPGPRHRHRTCPHCGAVTNASADTPYCSKLACREIHQAMLSATERSATDQHQPCAKRPKLSTETTLGEQTALRGSTRSVFSWSRYLSSLSSHGSRRAGVWPGCRRHHSFLRHYQNDECDIDGEEESEPFCVGHWLEAVDPRHPHNICAARVLQVLGGLLCIELDDLVNGSHQFWLSAHSALIFPCGFTHHHWGGQTPGVRATSRCGAVPGRRWRGWHRLLGEQAGTPAPYSCFVGLEIGASAASAAGGGGLRHLQQDVAVGQRVELAEPAVGGSQMVPARVLGERGCRVLLRADYVQPTAAREVLLPPAVWLRLDSRRVRPAGWAQKVGLSVVPALEDGDGPFRWDKYLIRARALPVPARAFSTSPTPGSSSCMHCGRDRSWCEGALVPGQGVELLDHLAECLQVRVARVVEVTVNGLVRVAVDGESGSSGGRWLPVDSWQLQPPGWSCHAKVPIRPPLQLRPGSETKSVFSRLPSEDVDSDCAETLTGEGIVSEADQFLTSHAPIHDWDCDTVNQFVLTLMTSQQRPRSPHSSARPDFSQILLSQEVDGMALLLLSKRQLVRQLQLPLGVAVKLLAYTERHRRSWRLQVFATREQTTAEELGREGDQEEACVNLHICRGSVD